MRSAARVRVPLVVVFAVAACLVPSVAGKPKPEDAPGYLDENNSRRGNSLSAPQVAGICALMLAADPELTPWKVKAVLEKTARDLKPRGKDPETGAGVVDAYAAVKAVMPPSKR